MTAASTEPDASSTSAGIGSDDRADRERQQRYQETERELLTLLDADNVDEATRKRKLVSLFDRFRLEYTRLSVQLRESLHTQRKLVVKCVHMKNELVTCALKIRASQRAHLDEIKSLTYYREECDHAWQQSCLSRERERDAVRIVDELRLEVDKLQLQVKALATPTAAHRRRQDEPASDPLAALGSPQKASKSPAKSASPGIMSFDEWKAATSVWCPSLAGSPRAAATPTKASLVAAARSEEIARCVSVPSLRPTPMERAVTATGGAPRSVAKPRSSHAHRDGDAYKVLASPPRRAGQSLPAVLR